MERRYKLVKVSMRQVMIMLRPNTNHTRIEVCTGLELPEGFQVVTLAPTQPFFSMCIDVLIYHDSFPILQEGEVPSYFDEAPVELKSVSLYRCFDKDGYLAYTDHLPTPEEYTQLYNSHMDSIAQEYEKANQKVIEQRTKRLAQWRDAGEVAFKVKYNMTTKGVDPSCNANDLNLSVEYRDGKPVSAEIVPAVETQLSDEVILSIIHKPAVILGRRGFISALEPLQEGKIRVTLVPTDGIRSYKIVHILAFSELEQAITQGRITKGGGPGPVSLPLEYQEMSDIGEAPAQPSHAVAMTGVNGWEALILNSWGQQKLSPQAPAPINTVGENSEIPQCHIVEDSGENEGEAMLKFFRGNK